MPGVDWIPGVSQLKSTVQLLTGDVEGAARTQKNFLQECPVVSQATSTAQLICGDVDGAIETQKRCLGTVNNFANGIPVVGHVKGGIHHAFGDHDGGNQALNAATRSSVVLASGAAAGIATGGLGAIPAGIAAGGLYDIGDSIISEKNKGFVAAVEHVVINPSAGTIFDATAVLVGDGLAGYAGGEIGNNVTGQMKLGKLEAARAAKMDKVNAALFEKGNSMTTGQLTQLGKQVNSLTGEINAIRHGTPQYWYDVKNNRVVVERGGGGGGGMAGTSTQYRNDEDLDKIPFVIGPCFPLVGMKNSKTFQGHETGFDVDYYLNEVNGGLTPAKRQQKLNEYKNQNTSNEHLTDFYSNSNITSDEELKEIKEKFDRGDDPRDNLDEHQLEILTRNRWFHVQMPSQFGYTGAIMANSLANGLLHSFERHWSQWQEHIEELDGDFMQRLEPIRRELENVQNAMNRETSTNATNALNVAIDKLDNETFIEIETAFFEAKLRMHRFIQNNVTYSQYLGEGITDRGDIQVFFKVTDQNGETRVMVLGISKFLTQPMSGFSDQRPVRQIVTAYFLTWDDYLNSKVRAGRAWL